MSSTAKVAVIENEIEAGLLSSVLADRSIPHTLRSYRDSAYDGIYQVQKGWGAVYAPAEFKEEILEVLDDIRGGSAVSSEQRVGSKTEALDGQKEAVETQKDSVRARERIDDRENAKQSED